MVLTKTNTGQGGHCRRRPTGKSRTTECHNIHRRNHENFGNLLKTIEKSIRHQSDPDGNTINISCKESIQLLKENYKHQSYNNVLSINSYIE